MLVNLFHCLLYRSVITVFLFVSIVKTSADQLALSEPQQCETSIDCEMKHKFAVCKIIDTSTDQMPGKSPPPTTMGQGQTTSPLISTASMTKSDFEMTQAASTKANEVTTQSETLNNTSIAMTLKPTTLSDVTDQDSQAITMPVSEQTTEKTVTTEKKSEIATSREFTSRASQTTDNNEAVTTMSNVISTEKQMTEQFTTQKDSLERTTYSSHSSIKRCVCDNSQGWFMIGDTCKYKADLDGICDSGTICIAKHSHCVPDGDNANRKRCRCKDGFKEVKHNNNLICAQILSHKNDPSCEICEENDGVCYSSTGNGKRDGCKCESSRQGIDCEQLLVNVTCSVPNMTMTICFKPTNRFNFVNGTSILHAKNKGKDEACKGKPARIGSLCSEGSIELVLSLKEELRSRCGTNHYSDGSNGRTYDNLIVAAERSDQYTENDLSFRTHCKFTSQVQKTINGIEVKAVPGNDRGETKTPNLNFEAEFQTGALIDPSYPIRVGDKIRLKIKMKNSESYSAILVTELSASSSHTKPDPKAVTVPLIMNSCPYENQRTFTNENTWRMIGSDPRELRTGLIRMFKLSKGSSVFFHSTVRICLSGEAFKCKLHNCTWPPQQQQSKRKKRALQTSEEKDTLELKWYEESDKSDKAIGSSSNSGLTVLFSVIAIATLSLIGITIFFVITKKKITFKKPEVWTTLPQRFAVPRLDQNKHVRM